LAAGMIQGKSAQTEKSTAVRTYSAFEKDMNALVRQHFPEWGCRSIDEL